MASILTSKIGSSRIVIAWTRYWIGGCCLPSWKCHFFPWGNNLLLAENNALSYMTMHTCLHSLLQHNRPWEGAIPSEKAISFILGSIYAIQLLLEARPKKARRNTNEYAANKQPTQFYGILFREWYEINIKASLGKRTHRSPKTLRACLSCLFKINDPANHLTTKHLPASYCFQAMLPGHLHKMWHLDITAMQSCEKNPCGHHHGIPLHCHLWGFLLNCPFFRTHHLRTCVTDACSCNGLNSLMAFIYIVSS